MRLYLSSFRVGDHPQALQAMAPPPARVALIGNACDAAPPDVRAQVLQVDRDQLSDLGYHVVDVDLRDFTAAATDTTDREDLGAAVRAVLEPHPIVYVRGGNVFVLREALARSGADHALVDLLADDAVAYAGYSAGPCVLAPDLHGLERCDPLADLAHAFPDAPAARFAGLGVLDRLVVPHLDSPGHPESALLGAVAADLDRSGTPYWALRDGDVLVVDGARTEILPRRHDAPRGRLG